MIRMFFFLRFLCERKKGVVDWQICGFVIGVMCDVVMHAVVESVGAGRFVQAKNSADTHSRSGSAKLQN